MDKKTPISTKFFGALLSSALILTSPGLTAWAAAASAITPISINTPIGGVSGAAGAVQSQGLSNLSGGNVNAGVNLTGSINPSLAAPQLSADAMPLTGLAPSVLPGAGLTIPEASFTDAGRTEGAVTPAVSLTAPLSAPVDALSAQNDEATRAGDIAVAPASRFQRGVARVRSSFTALKNIFSSRRDADIAPMAAVETGLVPGTEGDAKLPEARLGASPANAPNDAAAKTGSDQGQPPVPPSDDKGTADKGDRSWFGLGAAAAIFIGAMIVQQMGVESQAAAMPALFEKIFGDVSIVTDIAVVGSIMGILGRIMGPMVVNKYSLKKAYLGSLTAKVLVNGLLAGLLAAGMMTVPLLGLFYAVSGLLGGVAMTAEKAIPPAILGQDQGKLENFGAWKQTLLEVVGSVFPIVTGLVIAQMGFIPVLIAFPLAFAVSILLLAKFLKIPEKVEAMRQAKLVEQGAQKKGMGALFAEFWKKVKHGAKVVWTTPVLKFSFLAYTAYMIINPLLYNVLAPFFGVRLLGGADPNVAGVYTWLTGLYSAGGLIGGLVMLAEQKKLKKLKEGDPKTGTPGISDAEINERLRKSMLRWMMWGTVGLAAVATLAFPIMPFWGTLTLPALALIPFGIAQVIANIKQENFFVAKAPEADVNDVIGFLGAASMAISTLALVGMKFLFTGKLLFGLKPLAFAGLSGFSPFVAVAVAMIPLAGVYVYLTRKLAKVSAPPQDPQAPGGAATTAPVKTASPRTPWGNAAFFGSRIGAYSALASWLGLVGYSTFMGGMSWFEGIHIVAFALMALFAGAYSLMAGAAVAVAAGLVAFAVSWAKARSAKK